MTTKEIEVFDTGRLPEDRPFCSATRAGDMIFISGCTGHPRGQLTVVEGGVAPETRQALEHIGAVLEAAGSSVDRVAKCLV